MNEWTRPARAKCFLQSKQKRQTGVRTQCGSAGGRSLATRRGKENARFFLQAAQNGRARSSCSRSESAKASITQRQIEQYARYCGDQIKHQNARDAGKIGEGNERDLGGESKRNIKPRSTDPRFRGVEQPESSAQCRNYRDPDH